MFQVLMHNMFFPTILHARRDITRSVRIERNVRKPQMLSFRMACAEIEKNGLLRSLTASMQLGARPSRKFDAYIER